MLPANKSLIWKKNETILFGRVCPKAGTQIHKVKGFANNKGFVKEKLMRKIKNLVKFSLGPLYPLYVKICHNN